MRDTILFVGDELSAAGYRLAGIATVVPPAGAEAEAVRHAREQAEVVLLTSRCAAAIPRRLLEPWLAALRPLLLMVPDVRGATPVPDLAAALRTEMGA
jgi:vacuolar-type H+-ATPase subunit F/Vma7